MAYKMLRDSNGYYMNIEDIPEEAFMECIRVRDIINARILTKKERHGLARGSADVLIETPIGTRMFLTRHEVMEKYRYFNNKKPKMIEWESGKSVKLYRNDSTLAFALLLPKGVRAMAKGKTVNSGYYMICGATSEGLLDRTNIGIVSPAVFRKLFVMKPNSIIERNLGSGSELVISNKEKRIASTSYYEDNTQEIKADIEKGLNITNISTKLDIPKENTEESKAGKITAVARVMDAEGKMIGFIIENSIGRQRTIDKLQMLRVAEQGIVTNICAVEKNGSMFLRGINMHIKDLPESN